MLDEKELHTIRLDMGSSYRTSLVVCV